MERQENGSISKERRRQYYGRVEGPATHPGKSRQWYERRNRQGEDQALISKEMMILPDRWYRLDIDIRFILEFIEYRCLPCIIKT